MAAEFSLKIVASDHIFYDGKANCLIVPAIDGEQAIMAHHEEMLLATKEGSLRFRNKNDVWQTAVVGVGIVQVANNRAVVLVDSAERPEDIDEKRAQEALERAKEQLRQKLSIQEYKISQASMARALSRLREKQRHDIM